jgi:hypothetical protein
LQQFGRFGYVEMTRFLITKMLLYCRLSTGAPVCSVRGRHFSVRRIATSLRRCVHSWRIRRRTLLPYMGGSIIAELLILILSFPGCVLSISPVLFTLSLLYNLIHLVCGCVHLSYAEAGCNA